MRTVSHRTQQCVVSCGTRGWPPTCADDERSGAWRLLTRPVAIALVLAVERFQTALDVVRHLAHSLNLMLPAKVAMVERQSQT
eukprot:scaffold706_cov418-Prasinococcus_capsulatus_cf.AAC.18